MMKTQIYIMTLIFATGICAGCGKENIAASDQSTEIVTIVNDETKE